jgi:hypothetical protein
MKVGEFMKLTQGTRTLTEYLHAFNNLSRYALDYVNTKEKKIESFKRGLSTKLIKTMAISTHVTFIDFISDDLTQENQNNLHMAAESHKRTFELGPSQQRAPVTNCPPFCSPASGSRFRPPQKKAQPNSK